MAEKTSYLATSVLFLVLLLLLDHLNFCHSAEEGSGCGCPGTDLTKISVNQGSGAGIPFVKRSYGGWGGRNTFISGKSMNGGVVAVATVLLYGSTVAVFAYLCLKSRNFLGFHVGLATSIFNPSAQNDFDDGDNIMARRRIRARPNHQAKAL